MKLSETRFIAEYRERKMPGFASTHLGHSGARSLRPLAQGTREIVELLNASSSGLDGRMSGGPPKGGAS
jgi:hypothetical protein